MRRNGSFAAAADAAAGNVPRRDLAVTSADVEAKKTKPPTETWATAAGAAASRDEILRLAVEAVSGRREEKDATATTGMSESSYDDDYDAVLVVTPDDDIAPEAAPEAAAPEAAAPEAATAMAGAGSARIAGGRPSRGDGRDRSRPERGGDG